MSSLATGSSGSGALTQLIAQGALDQYLSANATFTFFRMRYNKCTNFAMESITQPWNTQVAFGTESHMTLNRTGDLIYFMYAVIDLPGLTAVAIDPDEKKTNYGFTGSQFPSCTDTCRPCKRNDERVMEEYLPDGYTEANEEEQAQMRRNAKGMWALAKYAQTPGMECCDEGYECPSEVCEDLGVYAHWTNDIGQFIISSAKLLIGGSPIDTLYSDFLYMFEELNGRSGRRLSEMTGKRYSRTQLVCDSRQRRMLFVPLPFWFTQHTGQSLPLASLQYHGVQVHVQWQQLNRCIITSSQNVRVLNANTGSPITQNDLTAALETTYIYLDTEERDRYATQQFEVLIVQTQAFTIQTKNTDVQLQLQFNHPVIELMWAVRRKCQEECNNWFNYSGIDNRDPLEFASLYLNNQPRFGQKPGSWFRLVQPYQFHSSIPDSYVYVYSFALHPEDPSPSGSCNMSRIDHVDMRLKLQDGLGQEQVTIMVFARNWNVLRFKNGLAGLAYAS